MTQEEALLLNSMGCISDGQLSNGVDPDQSFEGAMYDCFWRERNGDLEILDFPDNPEWEGPLRQINSGVDVENPVYSVEVDVTAPSLESAPEAIVSDASSGAFSIPNIEATTPSILFTAPDAYRIELNVNAPAIQENEVKPMTESELAGLFEPQLALQGVQPASLGTTLWELLKKAAPSALGGLAAGVGTDYLIGGETQAPNASLITGSCPPGMKRRKVAWGRDICVKKSTMNPLNPKALKRATTRISRFHHFAVTAEKQMAAAFRKGGFHPARRTSGGKCGSCKKTRCSCG